MKNNSKTEIKITSISDPIMQETNIILANKGYKIIEESHEQMAQFIILCYSFAVLKPLPVYINTAYHIII